jgi:hypothetical protein
MTHELQMLVASANARQLGEIAGWCADRANLINELAAEECFKEAEDLLSEELAPAIDILRAA